MVHAIGTRLVAAVRADPVRAAILLGFLVAQLALVGWDLPSSFAWDNDGVAPHDFAVGVAQDLTGAGFRYPLWHLLVLAVACAPALVPAALSARSFGFADLRDAAVAPATMTACSLIARGIAIAMGIAMLAALGRIAERLYDRRAARWTVLLAAANLGVAYYTRTSNLDGPALCWTVLAIERLIAARDGSPRDLTGFCVYGALAVATKDQAYAAILAVVPFALWARGPRALLGPAAVGALVYLVASGAALNPAGFAARVHDLLGPASGDYRAYAPGPTGIAANLADLAAHQDAMFWAWPVVALAWTGVALGARGRAAIPLVAGLGSLVLLALAIGRSELRFVLPLGCVLAIYAGRAAARLARHPAIAAAVAGLAVTGPLSLAITQRGDARYQVEHWLAAQRAAPGAPPPVIETYGPLVYLPRFDRVATRGQVRRVADTPPAARDPMPGMVEVLGSPGDARVRGPDVVVVTEGFAAGYLRIAEGAGRILSRNEQADQADAATRGLVTAVIGDRLAGYRLALAAGPPAFPGWARMLGLAPVAIHQSTGLRIWVSVKVGP